MDVRRLIEEVRRRPVLWDRTLNLYRPRAETQELWQEIGEVINQPTELCKRKWKNLRVTYHSFAKRNEKYKLMGIQKPFMKYNSKYDSLKPFYKEMYFIEKNRRTYGNDNNCKGRSFTGEHDQNTNSTDDTYGSETCSTSEIKIEPTQLADHETYLRHRESDADNEDFDFESEEIMLEEFQSIVSPQEPSQEPEVTASQEIFTVAKFPNVPSSSADYHQIKVAPPPRNHMSAVVARTSDEKTSEESTTNDGQCSSKRLDFESHEILLEEFQSIVSPQEPSEVPGEIAPQGIFTADKLPTITSTNEGYHQIIVAPPEPNHLPTVVPRTTDENTSEESTTNDGQCSSKRLDFEPHKIPLEEFQSIVSPQEPNQESEVTALQEIFTAEKFATITSTKAGYHQIMVTPPASTLMSAALPRTSVAKTSEESTTNDAQCSYKRSEKHVNSLANLEEEEQQLMKSTQKGIEGSTDLTDNPNYNFLISFLPQMDNMTYLQNLRFRARMSEIVLNIYEPNGKC